MAKTNVGVDMALVNLKNGGTALVPRGAALPAGLADGEEKRLQDLGVFTAPRTASAPTAPTAAGPDPRIAELEEQLAVERAAREAAEKATADAVAAAKS